VTVSGCQEVSLARPLQVPLPLKLSEGEGQTETTWPVSLLDLAAKLRKAFSSWQGEDAAGSRRGSREQGQGQGQGAGGGTNAQRCALSVPHPSLQPPLPSKHFRATQGSAQQKTGVVESKTAGESTAVVPG